MKVARVMERVYDRRRLHQAWHTVQRHAGAAGIDRMTVEAFAEREEDLLNLMYDKLHAGTYRFKPARRVSIPKPGTTKQRNRGIPVVRDRIVSHSVHSVLEELFDPRLYDVEFWVSPRQEPTPGHRTRSTGRGRRLRVVCGH